MIYVAGWILLIPILYVVYYSQFTNSEILNIPKRRKAAFICAIFSPTSLPIFMIICLWKIISTILRTNQFKNPIKIFPLHSPWEEDKQ